MSLSKMKVKKKEYFKISENAEKMGMDLMRLEQRYEQGKTSLKEIERNSKNFAHMKMNVEVVREQYKSAVVGEPVIQGSPQPRVPKAFERLFATDQQDFRAGESPSGDYFVHNRRLHRGEVACLPTAAKGPLQGALLPRVPHQKPASAIK